MAGTSSGAHASNTARPRPVFTRCVSSPFMSAAPSSMALPGLLLAHALLPSMSLGKSSIYHDMRRPSTTSEVPEEEVPHGPVGLGLEPSLNSSRRVSIDVVPARSGSLINGAADFAYLASEIQIESDSAEATPRPPASRKVPGTLDFPSFTFEPSSAVSTPFTPRFNPMDSFLGIMTPPAAWSTALSPRQLQPASPESDSAQSPPSPVRQVRWSEGRYVALGSPTPIAEPSKRVPSARKPVPRVNTEELDHSLTEASLSRATLRRGAVTDVSAVKPYKRRSITVLDSAAIPPVRPALQSRSRSEVQTRQATLSHRISMPVLAAPLQLAEVPIAAQSTARGPTSTSSFTRFFHPRKQTALKEKKRPTLRSHLSDSSGSSGSDRTLVEVREIFRKLGVSSPKQSPDL